MNILYCCDNNYSPYMAVSIYSILKSNRNAKIYFYIFDLGISEKNKNALSQLINSFGHKVEFVLFDEKELLQFPSTIKYISKATYARLKAAEYLLDVNRIIYIDVDTLTNADLSPLWEEELGSYPIGACIDLFIENETNNYKYKIGLSPKEFYFNAGILLIDLDKWRKLDLFNLSIKWLGEYQNIIKYQDQDILNGIFKGNVKYLNTRYNFMPEEEGEIRGRKIQILAKPPIAIYHYCGPYKFWHKKCTHTKAELGYRLFKELNKKYLFDFYDKFEYVDILTRLKRIRKEFKDKIIFSIR